jgi:hypothetical protein
LRSLQSPHEDVSQEEDYGYRSQNDPHQLKHGKIFPIPLFGSPMASQPIAKLRNDPFRVSKHELGAVHRETVRLIRARSRRMKVEAAPRSGLVFSSL